jgi:hypothetical protein
VEDQRGMSYEGKRPGFGKAVVLFVLTGGCDWGLIRVQFDRFPFFLVAPSLSVT